MKKLKLLAIFVVLFSFGCSTDQKKQTVKGEVEKTTCDSIGETHDSLSQKNDLLLNAVDPVFFFSVNDSYLLGISEKKEKGTDCEELVKHNKFLVLQNEILEYLQDTFCVDVESLQEDTFFIQKHKEFKKLFPHSPATPPTLVF